MNSLPLRVVPRLGRAVRFVVARFGGAARRVGAAGRLLTSQPRRRREARLRRQESRSLLRELTDIVAHHLSNISLQAMSSGDSTDVDGLRRAMGAVSRSATLALVELRLMVRVLRVDPAAATDADLVGDLSRETAPAALADAWSHRLRAAGFDPAVEIPAEIDQLGTTTQTTIARTVEVCCDNVLRHAPPGARCLITLSIERADVVVSIVSPLSIPPARRGEGTGRSLQNLRRRIDLIGGTLRAGESGAGLEWVVVAVLPRE